ncbi:peptidase S49 [Devosia limi DSM 17137]|uniref:Peptidase S49 n=1 Tax=Devosia limi DSM 17137 TaxID=1121477 RepID=A0A0F5LP79_9HYPH|nr:S49 family peptidase [Devosia limi]KKB83959.1 peptidase S49 [Devosia limi DSM 17137]SHE46179.1 signal peptide peptidase SppA [Devosia limi DSM 17137]
MAHETSKRKSWLARLFRRVPVIPVVRLHGIIAAEQRQGRLNIANVEPLLKRAFAIKSAPAVAIIVNSPGGSPVQSRLISKRIRNLADEHGKTVLVFVEDAAASGGYFIAVAGDEIIADPSSIVGSIGVIMAGFGFVGALDKLGVERRVHTAGKNKSTLDPFLPEKAEDIDRIKSFELDIHQVFIDHVKGRRGARLKASDETLFTGEWWTGLRGLDLGLIDGLGDLNETLRSRYGKDIALKPIEAKRGLFNLPRFGFSIASDVSATVEDRAAWARFGL